MSSGRVAKSAERMYLYRQIAHTLMRTYLQSFFALTAEMAPYLLLGFLLAGILHVFVPKRFYARYLARNDFRSVCLSALFGVPLPLCSCGVIPTAMSMRLEGASKAATVAFLIATPQTGVDSIAATASLLGVPFAVIRPVAAFVTALGGGWLVGATAKPEEPRTRAASAAVDAPAGWVAKCRAVLRYGFSDMVQDIGKHLLVGLLLAGAIAVFLPDDFFRLFADRPLLNMLLVLLLSVPMYVCATGSVPIAAALMLKGLTPGAALVLLMAGPATNLAAILVIGKVMGRRTLVGYLVSILIGAFGFGMIVDYLLPAQWFAADGTGHLARCCHGGELPLWKSIAAGVLLLLVAAALLRRRHTDRTTSTPMGNTFAIEGMVCNHCKAHVEKAIASVEGVDSVTVDLASGRAEVTGTADPERIVAAVTEAGYTCRRG